MKKNFFWILLFFTPLLCSGAKYDALIDDDKGQLLYDTSLETVWVYQKSVAANKRWACTPFRGSTVLNVVPGNCIVLGYNESDLQPDLITMELAYWANKDLKLWHAYFLITKKMNSEQTNKVRTFFADLNTFCKSIKDLKGSSSSQGFSSSRSSGNRSNNRSPQGSSNTIASLLQGSAKSLIGNSEVVKHIEDASDDGNFFLAFCLYRVLVIRTLRTVSNLRLGSDLYKEFREELMPMGEELRQDFLKTRGNNQNREMIFKKMCSNKHGSWQYASPASLSDMWTRTQNCYAAICKIKSLSPYSEFPDWGNAMLEVLQMIKNPRWEQQFDRASSEYQKNNNI